MQPRRKSEAYHTCPCFLHLKSLNHTSHLWSVNLIHHNGGIRGSRTASIFISSPSQNALCHHRPSNTILPSLACCRRGISFEPNRPFHPADTRRHSHISDCRQKKEQNCPEDHRRVVRFPDLDSGGLFHDLGFMSRHGDGFCADIVPADHQHLPVPEFALDG